MHLRNRQLACLLLLLSSLSAGSGPRRAFLARWGGAQARALRRADLTLGGRYICTLLIHMQTTSRAISQPLVRNAGAHSKETMALRPAQRSLVAAVWTMHPPAAHTAELQAFTARYS
ncbi:MAG: hypothetical protein ACP5E5_06030 [Acidobacteriaceae bacterium]